MGWVLASTLTGTAFRSLPGALWKSFEGSSSICDEEGNLLFFTNGGGRPTINPNLPLPTGTIWDQNGYVMYDMMTLSVQPNKCADLLWSTGETSDSISVGTTGLYTVTATDGCETQSLEIEIKISETLSLIDVEITPSTCNANNGSIEVNVDNGLALFNLNNEGFGENNFFEDLEAGDYSIIVQDELGCEVKIDTVIENTGENCEILIPDMFTPNGDGTNDWFNIVSFPEFQGDISLRIFSRWGQEIFNRSNIGLTMDGWDGTKNGKPMPMDVYVYIFEITTNAETEVLSGEVTLLR